MSFCYVAVVGAKAGFPSPGAVVAETREVEGRVVTVTLVFTHEWFDLLALDGLLGLGLMALEESWARDINVEFLQQFDGWSNSFVFGGKSEWTQETKVMPLETFLAENQSQLLELVFIRLQGACLAESRPLHPDKLEIFAQHPVYCLRNEYARVRKGELLGTRGSGLCPETAASLENLSLPSNFGHVIRVIALSPAKVVAECTIGLVKAHRDSHGLSGRLTVHATDFVLSGRSTSNKLDCSHVTLLILKGMVRVEGSLPAAWTDPMRQVLPRCVAEGGVQVLPASKGEFKHGRFTGLGRLNFHNGFVKAMIRLNRLLCADVNIDMPVKIGPHLHTIAAIQDECHLTTAEGLTIVLDYEAGMLRVVGEQA